MHLIRMEKHHIEVLAVSLDRPDERSAHLGRRDRAVDELEAEVVAHRERGFRCLVAVTEQVAGVARSRAGRDGRLQAGVANIANPGVAGDLVEEPICVRLGALIPTRLRGSLSPERSDYIFTPCGGWGLRAAWPYELSL